MDDKSLNEHLTRIAQAVARLEHKTDFILDHLNLTYVDTPGKNIPLVVSNNCVTICRGLPYILQIGSEREQRKELVGS